MKLKCYKCDLYFKDREYEKDIGINKMLCYNCRIIWQFISMIIESIPARLNRRVAIDIDDVKISKLKAK